MGEMRVVGIRVESPQNQPVLLLREADGTRFLPIWIGQSEAASIALQQRGIEPPRPLTHDLIVNLCEAFDQKLTQIRIVDVSEGTFYADLVFDSGIVVSARPSDAVAIALRTGATIVAADEVLDGAGLEIPDEDAAAEGGEEPGTSEEELEAFREFLDQVSPEDFLGPDAPG
ncbi:bifunctional nuclease family protein [Gordonia sp. VNK21]|uniref:bifunctional nuclease family protein n=1 Tax=Gordonia sp. VNK21 TaxID=3382483 RepID=UPI0038D3B154